MANERYQARTEDSNGQLDSPKDLFLHNTFIGKLAIIGLAGYIIYLGFGSAIYSTASSKQLAPVVQRNVIGDERPEIYIERDGVKYFSHADGQDISDLINK